MSFIKHMPFVLNDIAAPPAWTQHVELLGQTHLLKEDDNAELISVDVSHLTAQELSVELIGNTITVTGDHREMGHVEKFQRHFTVDNIGPSDVKANLYDGVLMLSIMKHQTLRAHRIPISEEQSVAETCQSEETFTKTQ